MSDVKQRKQRKRKEPREETSGPKAPKDEPTKEEYKIARWMRNNIPTKKTKFLSHTVEYFTACKAVDQLLESPWAKAPTPGEEALFTTRESVVDYMDVMLRHKMFHRARKIIVPESELKSKKKKDKEKDKENTTTTAATTSKDDSKKDVKNTDDESSSGKNKDNKKKMIKDDVTAAESSQAEGGDNNKVEKKKQKKEEGEKKKRKIRLDMHLDQCFVDGLDAYVWIYEPTPYYYYFFGFLVVIAVIAVCLFPLWPSSVRQGVYYLSLAAAGFLVFILALAVIRLVFFCLIWGLTFGRHHLWLLPNLTEDVGFFASFWPLYKLNSKGDNKSNEDSDEKKKNKNNSDSNNGDGGQDDQVEGESNENNKENENQDEVKGNNLTDNSETESEGSQKSQTGKDDFEILEKKELESYNLTS